MWKWGLGLIGVTAAVYVGSGYVMDTVTRVTDIVTGANEERKLEAAKLGVTWGKGFREATDSVKTAAARSVREACRAAVAAQSADGTMAGVIQAKGDALALGALANAWAESRLTPTAGGDVESDVPQAIGLWQLHARGLGRGVPLADAVNVDKATAIVLGEAAKWGIVTMAVGGRYKSADLCYQWCALVERPSGGCSSRWSGAIGDKRFVNVMLAAGFSANQLK